MGRHADSLRASPIIDKAFCDVKPNRGTGNLPSEGEIGALDGRLTGGLFREFLLSRCPTLKREFLERGKWSGMSLDLQSHTTRTTRCQKSRRDPIASTTSDRQSDVQRGGAMRVPARLPFLFPTCPTTSGNSIGRITLRRQS